MTEEQENMVKAKLEEIAADIPALSPRTPGSTGIPTFVWPWTLTKWD